MLRNIGTNLPEANLTSIATTAAIGGALVGVSYLIKSSIKYSGAPPGPRRIPILGQVELSPEDGSKFNDSLQEVVKKYGPIVSMYLGNKPIVIISDYAILREAFVTNGLEVAGRPDFHFASCYNPQYPIIKGIIDGDYSDEWKRQRHTALTILRNLGWGKSIIERRIQEESNVLLDELEDTKGKAIRPVSLLETCVANIICSLLFGERYHHGDKELQELLSAVDALLTGFAEDPGSSYIPIVKLFPAYWRIKKILFDAGGRLLAFYQKKIQEAKDKILHGEETEDFVSLYLKELAKTDDGGSEITQDWSLQLVSDFFIAGAETSATTMQWAVLLMANHQDIQEKVLKEINSKIGRNDTIFLKDREKLPYAEATIMEIQRLSAIAPIGALDRALVDTNIGGYFVPKDTEVCSNLYAILHDPKEFPEPKKFVPARFLDKNMDSVVKKEQWVPFSLGRRTCLGEQLARQEIFIFFTNIVRSFRILPPEGVDKIEYTEDFKSVLKPSEFKVRFVKR